MRDDDKLRIERKTLQIGSKSIHVCVVERRFDFVQNTERHRTGFQDCKQNRNRRERALTARKQGNFRELFTGGTSHDFHTRRKRVFAFLIIDLKFRSAAAEQFFERRFEVFVNQIKTFVEDAKHFAANLIKS